MAKITETELLESTTEGFEKALSATDQILGTKNSMRGAGRLSSKFVYEVGSAIHRCLKRQSPKLCLRVIKVDDHGERKPGEWLVDACVTDEHRDCEGRRFIDRVVFAMESESDPGVSAFNDDFPKLLHLNAKYKLYLSGLKQKTPEGMKKHICTRCDYAEEVLRRIRPSGEIYLGFWPSPAKPRDSDMTVDSIWRWLHCDEWRHLNRIRLWHFDQAKGRLIKVRQS